MKSHLNFLEGETKGHFFRGHIIAHFKGFSVGSNGFFTKFHFVSWFMRYH
jgi:hypothetical protein